MSGKPKISVEVDRETYDRYKEYASREGLKLSQWVRRTLDQKSPDVQTGAKQAFESLDKMEMGPFHPPPAVRRIEPLPPAPPVVEQVERKAGLPPGHPCRFHRIGGACGHVRMGGRDCRWPAPVATHCDSFGKLAGR